MKYAYECPSCGWKGDRICKIAERDEQLCEKIVPIVQSGDGQGGIETLASAPCGTKLVREEISRTANMGYNWGSWSGSSGGHS